MTKNIKMIKAILVEIKEALHNLVEKNETYTIYLGNTGLSEEDIVEVLETLGKGDITIEFTETNQPVMWYETNFKGVWAGVYRNQRDEAILYTLEVTHYPEVAQSFNDDILEGMNDLQELITAADI